MKMLIFQPPPVELEPHNQVRLCVCGALLLHGGRQLRWGDKRQLECVGASSVGRLQEGEEGVHGLVPLLVREAVSR